MKNLLIIAFILFGINTFAQSYDNNPRIFNVKMFGAKGDGITNDGPAIKRALAADSMIANNSGVIYFPNGTYVDSDAVTASCNCQIRVPYVGSTSTVRGHVSFLGESKPNMLPVGGGSAGAVTTKTTTGVIIKSALTSGTSNAAILGTDTTAFNFNYLSVENLAFQVKNNPSGSGPVIGGINWTHGASVDCHYVTVYIDTSGIYSTIPTNDVSGIELPTNQGEEWNVMENTLVVGFRTGYKIAAQDLFLNSIAWCCYYAFNTTTGGSPSSGPRLEADWCAYGIYNSGNPMNISNFNISSELTQTGNWYDLKALIKDSLNDATGTIYYNIQGTLVSGIVKSGGALLTCLTSNEGVASGNLNYMVFPTVSNGNLNGGLILGGNNGTPTLTLKTTTSTGGTGSDMLFEVGNNGADTAMIIKNSGNVGIGTSLPLAPLEVKTSGNTNINFNTSSSTGGTYLSFQKSGTNKWQIGNDISTNGTSAFSIYDDKNSKYKIYCDSLGFVNLGGSSNNGISTLTGISIDSSAAPIVYMNGTNFKMNSATHGLELSTLLTVPQINAPSTSLTLNPSGKVFFGSNGAYDIANTALGLGTTSPNSLTGYFWLNLNASTASMIELDAGGTNMGKMFALSGGMYLRSGSSNALHFQVNNTTSDAMTILSTGLVGVNQSTPTSGLQINTSFATAYVGKTATYTAGATDGTINFTSGTDTCTLPTAVGIIGRIYTIVNSGTSVFINTTSSQTFANVSGTPTSLLKATLGTIVVQSNGANWLELSSLGINLLVLLCLLPTMLFKRKEFYESLNV